MSRRIKDAFEMGYYAAEAAFVPSANPFPRDGWPAGPERRKAADWLLGYDCHLVEHGYVDEGGLKDTLYWIWRKLRIVWALHWRTRALDRRIKEHQS